MKGRTGRTRNIKSFSAVLAFITICGVATLFKLIAPQGDTPTPESSFTATFTPKPGDTPIPTASVTATLVIDPTPADEITVNGWNIEYICDGETAKKVKVLGISITGGVPDFTLETFNDFTILIPVHQTAKTYKINPFPYPERARIDPPIILVLGRYITIDIKSGTPNGEPHWSQDVYFPPETDQCD